MKRVRDPKTGIYRTEYPRAGWFTYSLMFLTAFLVGAAGGIFMAFRMALPRRGVVRDYEGTELAEYGYAYVAGCAVAGGMVGIIGLAGLLWGRDE